MFTGIVEEIGQVLSVQQFSQSLTITILASKVIEDVQLGDSIAVNGVCLTVTSFTHDRFTVDVMPETYQSTSLRHVTTSLFVNLERAIAANRRFGGHFVTGHIDNVATIMTKQTRANALYIMIRVPKELVRYLMPKGSVTVDGVSLTIFDVGEQHFTISLIPHTQQQSTLAKKQVGQIVNIECDVLAKYVERLIQPTSTKISTQLLEEHGFM